MQQVSQDFLQTPQLNKSNGLKFQISNHEFSEDFKKIAGHVLVVKKYKRKMFSQAFLNGSNSQFAELKRILEASCERPLKFRGPKQI